ncbi:unnamed protein product [Pleuronectes platessa]|uniref:Uncharacterized protein n=1 Tax=Pleuronectes platessa TaxID=8262 RepID=A0A9N7Y657_PLEPL|nr:unnamed protein product [Pleuronectes platessa]
MEASRSFPIVPAPQRLSEGRSICSGRVMKRDLEPIRKRNNPPFHLEVLRQFVFPPHKPVFTLDDDAAAEAQVHFTLWSGSRTDLLPQSSAVMHISPDSRPPVEPPCTLPLPAHAPPSLGPGRSHSFMHCPGMNCSNTAVEPSRSRAVTQSAGFNPYL